MTNTVAQGINKTVAYKKQTGLGSPASGSGSQYVRRVTWVPQLDRDTYENNEIVSHQQSTGVTYGMKKPSQKLSALLSSGTYADFFAASLRQDFAATDAYAAGSDVTAAAAGPQFADASGGFLTAGLKVGDVGRWTGFTAAGNNGKNFLITALTANDMTGVFLNGDAVVAEAAGQAVTFTVVGKKTLVPLTGHTKDFFTFEDWYSDISASELWTDVGVSKLETGLPATGNATLTGDFIGIGRTLGDEQVLTDPAAESTTPVLAAIHGAVYLNGAIVGNATSATITIDDGTAAGEAVLASNQATDLVRARVKVSGQFTGLFDGTTVQAFYDDETPVSLILVIAADETATSDFMTFTMGRIKITGDAPDDGEKQIVRTYPFTAEINVNGGAALAWDKTILTIQDSAVA